MSISQGITTIRLNLIGIILIASIVLLGCVSEPAATQLPNPSPTSNLPSPFPTLASTPTRLATSVSQPTAVPDPAATESSLPSSAIITNISGHKQTYELGCEASAAVDWAGYYDVLIYESTFQFALPLSDNPNLGFVGSVITDGWGQIPPDAYGVHAPPIAELLREYGLPAQAVSGMSLEEVKAELAEGDPIIVWVIGNMVYSYPLQYVDKEGNAVTVAPYEHVVILTGYNETDITYMNNGNFFTVPIDVFLTSWSVLGNMAVIYE